MKKISTFIFLICVIDILHAIDVSKFIPKNFDIANKDCSKYIQNAIDTGKDIKFDNKNYLIEKPIKLVNKGQSLYGLAKLFSKSKIVFLLEGNLTNINIKDLTLVNIGSKNGGYDNAIAFYVNKKNFSSINNSIFLNLNIIGFGIGINLQGNNDSINTVQNCFIHDTLAKKRIGSGGGHGIYAKKGIFRILNNKIENMQGGILFSAQGIVLNNIIKNAFDDNGIYLAHSKNVTVSNNHIYINKTDGIAINQSKSIIVNHNIIEKAKNGCIRIQEGNNIIINQNICLSYGYTNHFIRGYAKKGKKGSSSVIISNNIFNGPLTGKGNPIIFKSGDTPYKNITIKNNIIKNIDTTNIRSWKKRNLIINIEKSFNGKESIDCKAINNQIINYKSNFKKEKLFKGVEYYENFNNK